jgi:hypothetical protein
MRELLCNHCGAALLDDGQQDLSRCPHCGRDPQRLSRAQQLQAAKAALPARKTNWPLVAIGLAILPCLICGVLPLVQIRLREAANPEQERPGRDPSSVRAAGWLAAKQNIPRVMHDPDSAEFPWDSVRYEPLAELTIDGARRRRFRVSGLVRGKNPLGALVANQWTADAIAAEGDWIVTRITLGDELIYISRAYASATASD